MTAPLPWPGDLSARCRRPGCGSTHSRRGRARSWPARCHGAAGSGSWHTTCPRRWTAHEAAVTRLALALGCLLASPQQLHIGACPPAAAACLQLPRLPKGVIGAQPKLTGRVPYPHPGDLANGGPAVENHPAPSPFPSPPAQLFLAARDHQVFGVDLHEGGEMATLAMLQMGTRPFSRSSVRSVELSLREEGLLA